jgi:hypothetical protein
VHSVLFSNWNSVLDYPFFLSKISRNGLAVRNRGTDSLSNVADFGSAPTKAKCGLYHPALGNEAPNCVPVPGLRQRREVPPEPTRDRDRPRTEVVQNMRLHELVLQTDPKWPVLVKAEQMAQLTHDHLTLWKKIRSWPVQSRDKPACIR